MDKIESIDKLNYLCNIIGYVTKQKYTIRDFCKKWFEEKMFIHYTTPEEAFYDFFCDKTFETYTMEIPDMPILASCHKNKFEGNVDLSCNWECENCNDCKWCVDCRDCNDCINCNKCSNCTMCINCNDCKDNICVYNCKHVYNSKFIITGSNMAFYEGDCDENCNINCSNCSDCIGCINCSDCTKCYFCNECTSSVNMNNDLQEYISEKKDPKMLFKMITLLDRISMYSCRCNLCDNCNYLCDGFKESNITYEFDDENKNIINDFVNNFL